MVTKTCTDRGTRGPSPLTGLVCILALTIQGGIGLAQSQPLFPPDLEYQGAFRDRDLGLGAFAFELPGKSGKLLGTVGRGRRILLGLQPGQDAPQLALELTEFRAQCICQFSTHFTDPWDQSAI